MLDRAWLAPDLAAKHHDRTHAKLPVPMRASGIAGPALAAIAVIGALGACGADRPGGTEGVTVRDSAGIRIVENHRPVHEGPGFWVVEDTPVVRIGVVDGAPGEQLYRVRDVTRLSDGRIVVANAGTHELRWFDAAGRFLMSVGRQGAGPGDFQDLFSMERLAGDSVLVYDSRLARVTVYDPTGALARTVALPQQSAGTWLVGRFPDDSYVAYQGWDSSMDPPDIKTGTYRRISTLVRYGADGAPLDTLGQFPWADAFVLVGSNSQLHAGAPFSPLRAELIAGDRLFVGFPERYEIGVYSADGTLRMLVRKMVEPLPVTPEDIKEYRRRSLEAATGDRGRRRTEELLAALEYPSHHRAFGAVLVDAAGNLWVGDYAGPWNEGAPRWSIFDPEGRWIGTVETPRRFGIREIGEDYVLGTSRDALGVEYVRLHRLRKAE